MDLLVELLHSHPVGERHVINAFEDERSSENESEWWRQITVKGNRPQRKQHSPYLMAGITIQLEDGDGDSSDLLLVAYKDQQQVGWMLLCTPPERVMIRWISVLPQYHQQGITSAMMKALMEHFSNTTIEAFVIKPYLVELFLRHRFVEVANATNNGGTRMIFRNRSVREINEIPDRNLICHCINNSGPVTVSQILHPHLRWRMINRTCKLPLQQK